MVVGLTRDPFRAESRMQITPDVGFDDAPGFDTLIVPGAQSLRESDIHQPIGRWLKGRAGATRRMVSVCTGFYGLASSGLLDGRRATTHWRHAADAQRRFPAVRVQPDNLFIKDGPFYSSAGMTAGIDLALALIEEDHGPELALTTAREMVVYMKRTGGQLQYSEPLRFQTKARDRFADLAARMASEPGAEWSVEDMAAQTGLSPRQFTRRFKAAFDTTPGAHLDALRFDEARRRLASTSEGLGRIVQAVGLQSEEAFRRAFERRFGVTPAAYRRQFGRAFTPSEIHDEARSRL
jgi:transcriptional regulator GlxA family with amidase domain